jgi:hypothetical protein
VTAADSRTRTSADRRRIADPPAEVLRTGGAAAGQEAFLNAQEGVRDAGMEERRKFKRVESDFPRFSVGEAADGGTKTSPRRVMGYFEPLPIGTPVHFKMSFPKRGDLRRQRRGA